MDGWNMKSLSGGTGSCFYQGLCFFRSSTDWYTWHTCVVQASCMTLAGASGCVDDSENNAASYISIQVKIYMCIMQNK